MGKLKDEYLMNDTPPLDLSKMMDGTFIRVTKYGSIPFYYFKDEGAWYMPGRISQFTESEVNKYDEQVEILYDPREG